MEGLFSWDLFHELPIVGILRGFDAAAVIPMTAAAYRGGLRTVEVAMNTEGAEELIRALRAEFDDRMNVGAGTVRDMDELAAALDAGAEFVVTPVVLPGVIAACREQSVPVIPGAFTPTEIHTAWSLGADLVKFFPAGRFGPSYVREVLAPLDHVRLVPTGGVRIDNLAEFFRCGAAGVGVGTTLFDRQRVAARDWEWLEQQAGRYAGVYREAAG